MTFTTGNPIPLVKPETVRLSLKHRSTCKFTSVDGKMFSSILLSVLVIAVVALVQSEIVGNSLSENSSPYCDPELCKVFNGQGFDQTSHIACGNNGSFAGHCRSPELMPMTDRRKSLILDLHNTVRNRVARGSLKGYKPAESMNMLKWDSELEYLASLNVATCRFAHDQCRNTNRFPFSGQNIGTIWQSNNFQSYSRRIKYVVGDWFKEYKDCDQSFIDKYHRSSKFVFLFLVFFLLFLLIFYYQEEDWTLHIIDVRSGAKSWMCRCEVFRQKEHLHILDDL